MTKKELQQERQKEINAMAQTYWEFILGQIEHGKITLSKDFRLFSCKATYNYIYSPSTGEIAGAILTSYSTPIAMIIAGESYRCEIDMLRHEYGYTATSCQHMSKFFNHILKDRQFVTTERYTYR